MPAQQFFPGTFWNQKLGADRVLVNDANNYAAKLAAQATRTKSTTPAGWYDLGYQTISVDYSSSVSVLWVDDDCRRVPVTLSNSTQTFQDTDLNGLPAICKNVPVPPDYGNAENSNDRPYVVINKQTGECFEFWLWNNHSNPEDGPYGATFGGYAPNVFDHPGVFPYGWGVAAAGFPLIAGMIRMQEFVDYVEDGIELPHAIRVQVADTVPHIAPAVRNDAAPGPHNVQGSTVDCVPEGLRVALPASYDPPASATPFQTFTQIAARDYGLIVADQTGGTVNICLESHHSQGSGYCEVGSLPAVTYPTPGFWDQFNAAASGANNPWNAFPWNLLQQVAYPQP